MTNYYITSLYKFQKLSSDQVAQAKESLTKLATFHGIKGLVIIGTEGINTTFSAPTQETQTLFENAMSEVVQHGELRIKRSEASKQPFKFFRVDERNEIVTFERPDLKPIDLDDTHVTAEQWEEMLNNRDADCILLDTRNDYETKIGIFDGAIDPKIKTFTQFQEFVREQNYPKDKKMMIFCTGGIRCEKAALFLKEEGYDKVYQLDGGILRYIEKFPNSKFKGECYVFDHRVALDQELKPSKKYGLCHHCGDPSEVIIACPRCGKDGKVCVGCSQKEPARQACSKDCAHHIRLAEARTV